MELELTATTDVTGLRQLLEQQQVLKLDAVVPATAITATADRTVKVSGLSVTDDFIELQPLDQMVSHLAAKWRIPVEYLRRMLTDRPDLFAENVNGWVQGNRAITPPQSYDDRRFFIRTFTDPETNKGYGRALLSDTYGMIDNLDALTAVLEAVQDTGTEHELKRCTVTERRMSARIVAPEIAVAAPILLKNYVSPYSGLSGSDLPVVRAGIDLHNGETGGSKFSLRAFLEVEICSNGMTMDAFGHVLSRVHLGGRMPEGIVHWSDETRRRQVEVVKSQAKDAVRSWMNEDYVRQAVELLEKDAMVPVSEHMETIALVATQLHYTEGERDGVFQHYIDGHQHTAGGVMQAVTSWAQQISDPDRSIDFEATAVQAMRVAAGASR